MSKWKRELQKQRQAIQEENSSVTSINSFLSMTKTMAMHQVFLVRYWPKKKTTTIKKTNKTNRKNKIKTKKQTKKRQENPKKPRRTYSQQ